MLNKTYLQTVEIEMPGAPFVVHGLEFCPINPAGVKGLKTNDGSTILWLEGKTVKWAADGTVLTWWEKPTMEEAVNYSNDQGGSYQFKSDGSIFQKYLDKNYFWSKPMDGCVESGTPINVHVCHEAGGAYFLKGEKCLCNICINCDNVCPTNSVFCGIECDVNARCSFTNASIQGNTAVANCHNPHYFEWARLNGAAMNQS